MPREGGSHLNAPGRRTRTASSADLPAIESLLKSAELPLEGVAAILQGTDGGFAVTEAPDGLLGCAAIEIHGKRGLLRSVAVRADQRGRGVGEGLVLSRIGRARDLGLETLHLLTTSAAEWFPRFGFRPVERADVPEEIRATWEFTVHCPSSAAVLGLSLASPVVFVLVRGQFAGNLGMVCRAAKAFGFPEVRLVRPVLDVSSPEARWFAHGAEDVLDGVRVFDSLPDALADCFRSIGTTARRRHSNRPMREPAEAVDELRDAAPERKLAVVFGPEDDGLSNHELALCDFVLSIPRPAATGATLSLPASATIVAWEIAKARGVSLPPPIGRADLVERTRRPLTTSDVGELVELVATSLEAIGLHPLPDAIRFRGSIRDFLARARPTHGDRIFLRHLFAQLEKWKRRIAGEARRGTAAMLHDREEK